MFGDSEDMTRDDVRSHAPILSAKSGSDWTENELDGFNIKVEEKTDSEFFGHPLPDNVENVSPVVLTHLEEPQNASDT